MTTNGRRSVNAAKYELVSMGKHFVGFMLDPNALGKRGRAAFEVSLLREIEQVDTSARADPSRRARPESDAELGHERGIELEHTS